MGKGQLKAQGSSLELKNQYGLGYRLHLQSPSPAAEAMVLAQVADAGVLTKVGTELTFALPLSQTPAFPQLVRNLEGQCEALALSMATLEEVFMELGKDDVPEVPARGKGKKASGQQTRGNPD